jgi:hypothetical protein
MVSSGCNTMSIRSRVLAWIAFVCLAACGLEKPAPPRPIVCSEIDRAEERFPDECGPSDSGAPDAGSTDDAGG